MTRIIDRTQFAKPPEILHKPGTRVCLKCDRKFSSRGIGNRLCRLCRYDKNKRVLDIPPAPCHTAIEDVPTSDLGTYW